MVLLRLLGLLAAVAIGVSAAAFLVTRDRRYLSFALRVTRYAVAVALCVFALLLLERLAALV